MPVESQLVQNYLRYCRYNKSRLDTSGVDLSAASFFFPSTLLPLVNLINRNPGLKYLPPSNGDVARYISLMSNTRVATTPGDTRCPIVRLGLDESGINAALGKLYTILDNGNKCGGENAFKYVLGELTDNIQQHSGAPNAFAMGQAYSKKKFTEICIFDDGISIPGAFKKAGIEYVKDIDAISGAITGKSTKGKERGFGIGTSLRILTQGLSGEVFIVSGAGAVFIAKRRLPEFFELNTDYVRHQGTIFSIRIPFCEQRLNISDYIDRTYSY